MHREQSLSLVAYVCLQLRDLVEHVDPLLSVFLHTATSLSISGSLLSKQPDHLYCARLCVCVCVCVPQARSDASLHDVCQQLSQRLSAASSVTHTSDPHCVTADGIALRYVHARMQTVGYQQTQAVSVCVPCCIPASLGICKSADVCMRVSILV